MARVFVDQAVKKTGLSQFELINMAAHRARQIANGATPMVTVKDPNEARAVTALREIEEGLYTVNHYKGIELTPEEQYQQAIKEQEQEEEEENGNQST